MPPVSTCIYQISRLSSFNDCAWQFESPQKQRKTGPEIIKLFMLNSAEHEILSAH